MREGGTSFGLLQIHNPNPVPILVTDLVSLQEGLEFAYLAQVETKNEYPIPEIRINNKEMESVCSTSRSSFFITIITRTYILYTYTISSRRTSSRFYFPSSTNQTGTTTSTFKTVGRLILSSFAMFVLMFRNRKILHDESSPRHHAINNALGGLV